jgi:hypothetical protein
MKNQGSSPGARRGSCPFLWEQEKLRDRVIHGYCRDPQTGVMWIPGFWEYWNRCRSEKHIVCRRYRFFCRQVRRSQAHAS